MASELAIAPVVSSIVYSVIGIVVFLVAYGIIDKLTPFSMRKEIEEDQNTALAIIIGSCFIALAMIISAAII
jgi:uncharacterized membrane protein YjfL (UPF0719 family)